MNTFLSASSVVLLRTAVVLAASNTALAQPSSPEAKGREQDASLQGALQGLYVTPEDFGAVGNDGEDDNDAFDQLVDAMRPRRGGVDSRQTLPKAKRVQHAASNARFQ